MQKVWESIFWKVLSCACFAGINVLVRYLSGGSGLELAKPLPIYTIMLFQNVLGMIFLSVYIRKNVTLHTKLPGLHALRIITAAMGIGLWYLSLRYIPVTQVVALSFIAPIITTAIAILLLRENLTWQRATAIFLSLAGGFLITRPDQALFAADNYNWYMLLPLAAALVFSLDKVFTRKLLVQQENSLALAWYLLTFISPLCLIPTLMYGWVTPTTSQIPWLLLLGALGALAHYTFNRAYALAEITFLLPFGAAKLLLCAVFSYWAFLELPNTIDIWLGITIITLSTLVLSIPGKNFNKIQAQTT